MLCGRAGLILLALLASGSGLVTAPGSGGGGAGGAPTGATYITQTPDATLTNEQALSALGTGLMLNTTTTGVVSIYPGLTCAATKFVASLNASGGSACTQPNFTDLAGTATSAQVPLAATATALAANPADCTANQYATTIAASGDLTCSQVNFNQLAGTATDAQLANAYSGVGACTATKFVNGLTRNAAPTCTQPTFADLSGSATDAQIPDTITVNLAATATALAANPADCGVNAYANAIAANGDLTCAQVGFSQLSGTLSHSALSGLSSGDDHTQYVLRAGRTGTTNDITVSSDANGTISGGALSSGQLILQSNKTNVTTGAIYLYSPNIILPGTENLLFDPDSTASQTFISFTDGTETVSGIDTGLLWPGGTYTLNTNTSGIIGYSMPNSAVISYTATTNPIFSLANLFNAGAVIQDINGVSTSGLWATPFVANLTFQANGAGTVMDFSSGVTSADYSSTPTFQALSSGAFGTAARTSYYSKPTVSSGTVATIRGFYYADKTGAGTLTNQIAVDIPNLTGATTINLGLRNASPTAFAPTPTQSIANGGGTTISCSATYIKIDYPTGGAVTVSPTPTIADGQDGQICIIMNVDSADTITLKDEAVTAGTNLRLPSHVNYALAPRDTITLIFAAVLGDWITIASSHN